MLSFHRNIFVVICCICVQIGVMESKNIFETNHNDMCSDVCHKMYPKVFLKQFGNPRIACQQGCELLGSTQLDSMDADISTSPLLCQKKCLLVFGAQLERFACSFGCLNRLSSLGAPPLESYPQNSEDIEPDDVLLDPALRTQLHADESPLPHLHIKTLPQHHLPVEELYQQFMERETLLQESSAPSIQRYWFDYFLTRMVLAAAVMLSVMCALWLCIVPPQIYSDGATKCESQGNSFNSKSYKTTVPPNYNEMVYLSSKSSPPNYNEVV